MTDCRYLLFWQPPIHTRFICWPNYSTHSPRRIPSYPTPDPAAAMSVLHLEPLLFQIRLGVGNVLCIRVCMVRLNSCQSIQENASVAQCTRTKKAHAIVKALFLLRDQSIDRLIDQSCGRFPFPPWVDGPESTTKQITLPALSIINVRTQSLSTPLTFCSSTAASGQLLKRMRFHPMLPNA